MPTPTTTPKTQPPPQLEQLEVRISGPENAPVLVYLPGVQGDWTLIAGYRRALAQEVRFVEFTYPRTRSWTMSEYGAAVATALQARGIRKGWIVAESFGSQVCWALLRAGGFEPQGLILAGGFVRYPWPVLVRIARAICTRLPWPVWEQTVRLYARCSALRLRGSPDNLAALDAFIARRTREDLDAAVHRLNLILDFDPSDIARSVTCPVYCLEGRADFIVPCAAVRRWLRRHQASYRGGAIIRRSDHAVLARAPRASAQWTRHWLGLPGPAPSS